MQDAAASEEAGVSVQMYWQAADGSCVHLSAARTLAVSPAALSGLLASTPKQQRLANAAELAAALAEQAKSGRVAAMVLSPSPGTASALKSAGVRVVSPAPPGLLSR